MDKNISLPIDNVIEGVLSPFNNNYFIGHDDIIELLRKMHNNKKWHHALLFSGKEGIGKQTLAFRLAYNILNHNNDIFAKPDYNNSVAKQMAQNIHSNFLYIGKTYDETTKKIKTNISINEIIKIQKFLTYNKNDYQIILIDSIDDLTINSANSLLKILEEPPKNTIFFLLSHEQKPVLPTIKSRCVNLNFLPLTNEQILKALENCLISADYSIEKAQQILTNAVGSVRMAAKLYLTKTSLNLNEIFSNSNLNLKNFIDSTDYLYLKEELLTYVANKAIEALNKNLLAYANKLSLFWQEIMKKLIIIENYNLDKTQELHNIFLELYKIKEDYETK